MSSTLIRCALTLAIAAATLCGAGKTSFNGTWKLNAELSDFGEMNPPAKMERKIDFKDPVFKLATTVANQSGEKTEEYTCTTDGKACENTSGPRQMTSYLNWEGDTLVVHSVSVIKRQEREIRITEDDRWTLSPDGKRITIETKLSTVAGGTQIKIVMDRAQ
jgi:hypothetical protein